jgi:hypothetical protein
VEDLGSHGQDPLERRLGDPREPLAARRAPELLLLELRGVGEILEAAAATGGEMRARRLDPLGPRPEDLGRERLRVAALDLRDPRPDAVAGSPRRTKTTKPSSRATPLPPYASESTSSSSSSPFVTGAAIAAHASVEGVT